MFTFISYWRTAAVVLCDLASTAYYIGGIVEQRHRPGRTVVHPRRHALQLRRPLRLHRSCSLFVRGGVYRVVKEAMGGFLAKLSVSALMFDYILTGPISGVSAGQYIIGLMLETIGDLLPDNGSRLATMPNDQALGRGRLRRAPSRSISSGRTLRASTSRATRR